MHVPLILVADDNEDDLSLTIRGIRSILESVQVVSAPDGKMAAQYLGLGMGDKAEGPLPDMAILDLRMPLVDGIQLLRMIRASARTQNLPVMVFSSGEIEEEVQEAQRLGAVYVQKPVNLEAYFEAVQGFIRLRLQRGAVYFDSPQEGS